MILHLRLPPPCRTLRWSGNLLIALGLLLFVIYSMALAERHYYQGVQSVAWPETSPASPGAFWRNWTFAPTLDPNVVGRLVIPRLDLSVIVREGVDSRTLRIAAGHLPNSALPGEVGNFVVAGHRDTVFLALKDIRAGDEIRIASRTGLVSYTVRTIAVVDPDEVRFLQPTARPTCTLVTCYPFSYLGPAPRRFIVQAIRDN